ncbi:MAG: 16S rRNA (uracil(1498)-N(3))-methyltransferase [Oscillospiraceae bacterium]|nr:16S rRNA (uracil(1498)-N(3))-methyltransferase [Oscillospiraceae bacterium]
MPRFFLPRQALSASDVSLTGGQAAHVKVLRLRPGDRVTVCDGQGLDYPGVLLETGPQVRLSLEPPVPCAAEPRLQVRVWMAYAKADKLEHVIQKATELGACEIIAFPSARCVSRPDAASLPKKLVRWQRIADAAAEQCGRGRIPRVRALDSFPDAVAEAVQSPLAVFLYEKEVRTSLRGVIPPGLTAASLMTGPEGGFTPEEARTAQDAGMLACTLGPRILRCETAPLCALSALMFACGELD